MSTLADPPSPTTITGALASYIASAAHTSVSPEVEDLAAQHVLDTVASIVACRDLHAGEVARSYARSHGAGDVTILGTNESATLIDAAFASAIIAHGAEINDFCPSAFVQPGPGVVSTALCLAEARGRSGADVIRAVVAGYELACRMPKAIGIDALRQHGVANHGIGALFGAATAAAVMLRLDEARVAHLLSYCAQQASGSWQWMLDIDHLEKSFVFGGMGVHNGLHAALLVESGFTGVPDVFDTDAAWPAAGLLSGRDRGGMRSLTDELGTRFELPLVGFKRFPVGGPVQPTVEAMLQLIDPADRRDITGVHIAMPGAAETFANARMPALNARYIAALIAIDGQLDFAAAQSLERFHGDERVRKLMANTTVVHDPDQEMVPRSESAKVTVEFDDGSTRTVFVDHVVGYPSHPMSRDDVVAKAEGLLAEHFPLDRVAVIVDTVLTLGTADSVTPLIDAIARP